MFGRGRADFAPEDILAQVKTCFTWSLGAHLRASMMASLNGILTETFLATTRHSSLGVLEQRCRGTSLTPFRLIFCLFCCFTLHDCSGSCEHTSYGTSLHSSLLVIVQSLRGLRFSSFRFYKFTCRGTRLQLTLGTVRHCLRGTFEHSCTSTSAHLSFGTSSHSCRGTSLHSSLEEGWGKMVLSPGNLLTSLSWHQAALLPLHLLTLFPETSLGQV